MNKNLSVYKNFMAENGVNCLLVNSTNKFLVEYNTLEENSRYKLTGFSGSIGDVLITNESVFLFVDGRYHIQADQEVDHSFVTVVKLQIGQSFLDELTARIPKGSILGVFSQKVTQNFVEDLGKKANIKLFELDPLDDDFEPKVEKIEVLEDYLTGLSSLDKIKKISLKDDEALVLTNLEEVSYLFNLRNFETQYSAKIKGKAVIYKDKASLYLADRLDEFEDCLKSLDKVPCVDKTSINAYDYGLVKGRAMEVTSPVKYMKTVKTDEEIAHYKDAFNKTDKAVLAVRDYIENTKNISEYDIAEKLEQEFYKNGARCLSFKSIVAKDKNSALAHYSKCSKNEKLKDGSLVLIDCGAYFDGGLATDITRVFVKGEPTVLQKEVYTKVLKVFLCAYNTKVTDTLCGYDIDFAVREFFANNKTEGFVFNHGLGHGIGINVHEAPPNLSKGEIAKAVIEENMCFTIEPGLYNVEHFGVRLENSCYLKDGKIRSFVHVPYEKKLINYDMLSKQEKAWLDEFGVI